MDVFAQLSGWMGGGSLGRWIRHGAQGPPWRGVPWGLDPLRRPTTPLEGVPWILDSPGPPLTASDSFHMK